MSTPSAASQASSLPAILADDDPSPGCAPRSGREFGRLARIHDGGGRFQPRPGGYHPHDGGVQPFREVAEGGRSTGCWPEVAHQLRQLNRERVDQLILGSATITALLQFGE